MALLKKDKIYFSMLMVGLVLIVVALINKNSVKIADDTNNTKEQASLISTTDNSVTANVLEGVLRNSDDLFRGNLKLVSQYSDIYIRTSRDFSSLIGLEVLAKINGTLDKFEFLDIEPRVIKDGYILQQ